MKNKPYLIIVLPLLLAGCITFAEKRAMQQDITTLQSQLEVLRKRLDSRSEELSESTSQSQATVAEVNEGFKEVRNEVARLKASLDEKSHFSKEEETGKKKVLEDYEMRFQDLEKRVEDISKQIQKLEKNKRTSKSSSRKSSKKTAKKSSPKVSAETAAYEKSIQFVKKTGKPTNKELARAEKDLKAFLKKYPKSTYKPNVHYWIGEINYGKGEYKRAIIEFEEVLKLDKNHPKAPGSLLKQGYCFIAINNKKTGKTFLELVVKRYPKSKEAALAKKKLAELQGTSGGDSKT